MAAEAFIISKHDLSIDVHQRNQSNEIVLALYSHYICFNSRLKQLYISNKTEHFIYKDGCGMRGCHMRI